MKSKKEKKATQKLSVKQKRFCDEYLKDLNGTQGAIRAGYSKKTADQQASRLLTNVKVQEYIQSKQKKIAKKNDLTVEWVLKKAKKVFKRCMQEESVKDNQGNPTGEFKFEHSGANKSLELIGRHLGMFNDKVKLTVTNETDEELMAEADELLNTARARAAEANSGGAEEEES